MGWGGRRDSVPSVRLWTWPLSGGFRLILRKGPVYFQPLQLVLESKPPVLLVSPTAEGAGP